MIKEALQWIQEQSAPVFREHNGKLLSNKTFNEIIIDPHAPTHLEFKSLTSFCDFINNTDVDRAEENNFVTMPDWNEVRAFVPWDGNSTKRIHVARCVYDFSARFETGKWYEQGDFIALVLTMFSESDERNRLLDMASKIVSESSVIADDDKISQRVTIADGIKRKAESSSSNPYILSLYRTWPEVEQPVSPFVLRIQKSRSGDGFTLALFDFGGDLWKVTALQNANNFLKSKIKNAVVY